MNNARNQYSNSPFTRKEDSTHYYGYKNEENLINTSGAKDLNNYHTDSLAGRHEETYYTNQLKLHNMNVGAIEQSTAQY